MPKPPRPHRASLNAINCFACTTRGPHDLVPAAAGVVCRPLAEAVNQRWPAPGEGQYILISTLTLKAIKFSVSSYETYQIDRERGNDPEAIARQMFEFGVARNH